MGRPETRPGKGDKMPGVETELHPDDAVNITPIKLQCATCGAYLRRETAAVDGNRSKYTYVCDTKGCETTVHVLVPR